MLDADIKTNMDIYPLSSITATIAELLLLVCIIMSGGIFLILNKSTNTNNSYIHKYFEPFDTIMCTPSNISR